MKTLNYSKLARRVLSLAGLVVTGTVVSLPASAQVESPSLPMGAPSLESPVDTPDDSITPAKSESSPSVPTSDSTEAVDSNPIESTLEAVEEVVSPDATEATEVTETTETTTEVTETTTPGAVTEEATEATETTTPDAATEEATETIEETTETTSEAIETTIPDAATDAVTEEVTETTSEAIETTTPGAATEEVTETTEATESPADKPDASSTDASPAQTSTPTSEVPATQAPSDAAGDTIVEVASASETFNTLIAAVTEAELTEVLQGEGPFTIFAPTDEAFAALPEGALEQLLQPENRDLLVKILTYHVIPGEVMSSDLASGDVETVEGNPITVEVGGEAVTVNDANVVQADIPASNGVIHAIDRVILPPDLQ